MPVLAEDYLTKVNALIQQKKIKFTSVKAIYDLAYVNNHFSFLEEETLIVLIDEFLHHS